MLYRSVTYWDSQSILVQSNSELHAQVLVWHLCAAAERNVEINIAKTILRKYLVCGRAKTTVHPSVPRASGHGAACMRYWYVDVSAKMRVLLTSPSCRPFGFGAYLRSWVRKWRTRSTRAARIGRGTNVSARRGGLRSPSACSVTTLCSDPNVKSQPQRGSAQRSA